MGKHFKKYGHIHLAWIIVLLFYSIIALIVYTPNAKIIEDYIAFAATFSSLFLSIVAIFYSIISSHSLSGSLSGTLDAVQRITGISERLDTVSQKISAETQSLAGEVSRVPESVRSLQKDLSDKIESFSQSLTIDKTLDGSTIDHEGTNIGFSMSMYVLSLMSQTGKSVNITEFYNVVDRDFSWILFGVLTSLNVFSPCEIKIDAVESNFKLRSMGKFDLSHFNSLDVSDKSEGIKGTKENIEKYFGIKHEDDLTNTEIS